MSIIIRTLTSNDDLEILHSLEMLIISSGNTGFLHESYSQNNSTIFTRSWFAWVNTLFGELILQLKQTKPHLIF
jgi:meiotically up-regulated gene 157 (Mug157) protein